MGQNGFHGERGFFEHLEHRLVLRQNIGGETLDSMLPGDTNQQGEQEGGNPASLIVFINNKGRVGVGSVKIFPPDIAGFGDDSFSARFLDDTAMP